MGTKGCFRMKEGGPLEDRQTEPVMQLPRQPPEGLSYLLPLPLMGLVQSSSPETSEGRRKRRYRSILAAKAHWRSSMRHRPARSTACTGFTKSGFFISNHCSSSEMKLMMLS